jgi:pimeloyl-ACP methyl ester carboxylesterase
LEKLLTKTLAPVSISPVLIYPTGPNRLLPSDMPFFVPTPKATDDGDDDYQPDTWAWWRKDETSGEYLYLEKAMETIAQAIAEAGGIDGICGFSQGGAATGIVAAALEPERAVPQGPAGVWVRKLREANGGRPVNFAVSYSGFWALPESLQFLYEPKLSTPTLHYIGSLDTVVEESRSQALIERCQDAATVVHPGGHHVPVSKEWVMPLAGFIKQHVYDVAPRAGL